MGRVLEGDYVADVREGAGWLCKSSEAETRGCGYAWMVAWGRSKIHNVSKRGGFLLQQCKFNFDAGINDELVLSVVLRNCTGEAVYGCPKSVQEFPLFPLSINIWRQLEFALTKIQDKFYQQLVLDNTDVFVLKKEEKQPKGSKKAENGEAGLEFYDDTGRKYKIPSYILTDPKNVKK